MNTPPSATSTRGGPDRPVARSTGIGPWRDRATREAVVDLPWEPLVGVFSGEGAVASRGPQPAFVLVPRVGASLTSRPAAKTTESLRTDAHSVPGMVERLNCLIADKNAVPGLDDQLGA